MWTGAGQALRWALWCSARTPLQDGDDDSPHCQFCHPTQDASSLHLRRATPAPGLPMDVNERLGCNYINSSSSQLLVPSPLLSLKSILNKLPMKDTRLGSASAKATAIVNTASRLNHWGFPQGFPCNLNILDNCPHSPGIFPNLTSIMPLITCIISGQLLKIK